MLSMPFMYQKTVNIIFTDDAGRLKITVEKHILCYLWFIGHESAPYRDVADRFGITLNSLYNIITRVTDFILSFANNIIKYPNAVEKAVTAAFYEDKNGFPGVIGNIYTCPWRETLSRLFMIAC